MSDREPMRTLTYINGRNKEVTRDINFVVDARDFKGLHGEFHLLMAANPHLSGFEMWLLLAQHDIELSDTFIYNRRKMYRAAPRGRGPDPETNREVARAFRIMAENRTMNPRRLAKLLREKGIDVGKDWVRLHRVEARKWVSQSDN
jgi:hypothetical protein